MMLSISYSTQIDATTHDVIKKIVDQFGCNLKQDNETVAVCCSQIDPASITSQHFLTCHLILPKSLMYDSLVYIGWKRHQ